MRVLSIVTSLFFLLACVVQWNDPDPLLWVAAYGIAAATGVAAFFGVVSVPVSGVLGFGYLIAAWLNLPVGAEARSLSLGEFGMASLQVEQIRESLGLAICAGWMAVLIGSRISRRA